MFTKFNKDMLVQRLIWVFKHSEDIHLHEDEHVHGNMNKC